MPFTQTIIEKGANGSLMGPKTGVAQGYLDLLPGGKYDLPVGIGDFFLWTDPTNFDPYSSGYIAGTMTLGTDNNMYPYMVYHEYNDGWEYGTFPGAYPTPFDPGSMNLYWMIDHFQIYNGISAVKTIRYRVNYMPI